MFNFSPHAWLSDVIVSVTGPPSYVVELLDGRVLKHHKQFIMS